jgi:archaellum component FlaC
MLNMAEEKSLFERLDDISAGQSVILNEITGVKTQVSDTDSKITELEQEIQKLKSRPIIQPSMKEITWE